MTFTCGLIVGLGLWILGDSIIIGGLFFSKTIRGRFRYLISLIDQLDKPKLDEEDVCSNCDGDNRECDCDEDEPVEDDRTFCIKCGETR